MHPFKSVSSILLVAVAILMLAAPAMAGKGYGSGYRQGGGKTGSGIKQRLRDGSCRGVEVAEELDREAGEITRRLDQLEKALGRKSLFERIMIRVEGKL